MTYKEAKNYLKELRHYKHGVNDEIESIEDLIDANDGAALDSDIGSLPTSPPPPPPPRP